MIVKVQVSLFSTDGTKRMLIYNEDRSTFFEGDLTQEVRKAMDGQPKAYFEAKLIDTKVNLIKKVAPQDW